MKLCEYYKNLSNTLSGNYFAMLGFVCFIFPTIGLISRYIQALINSTSINIMNLLSLFLNESIFYLPILCVIAIIPIICLFIFLQKSIFNYKYQAIILFIVTLICTSANFIAEDYKTGAGVFFALVTAFLYPISIIAFVLFLILLWCDFTKTINIKNKILTNNRYYKVFIRFFYYYCLSLFVLAPFIILFIL